MQFHIHKPTLHPIHVKHLQQWKHFHWCAQFTYLITEFSGFHMAHIGCTVLVVLGMALFLIAGEEIEGV